MPRKTEQKIKLLVLYEILHKYSDEEHPMTTTEIVSMLEKCGITATRQTIYEDVEVLNQYGYEVLCDKSQKSNRYFVSDRAFERPEIQVLLNAVGAAKFLTEKKTSALAQKVAELLGSSQAEQLTETLAVSNGKHINERIYYSIDEITSAILEKKKVSFCYFDFGIHGEKIYRKNKDRYVVNPLGLVYSEDNFYLVCFHDKYKNAVNYRIDRMEETHEEEEGITKLEEFENFDINAYKKSIFSMYVGDKTEVSLN